MIRVLVLLLAMVMFAEGREKAGTEVSSMVDYLRGAWLVRPADLSKGGLLSAANFTHILQLNSSLEDESVLNGTVDPYEQPSMPWFVEMMFQCYFALDDFVGPLLGRQPRQVEVAVAPELPLFKAFDVMIIEENYISGAVLVDQRSGTSCPGPRHLNLSYVAHYSTTEGQASRLRIASGSVQSDGSFSLDVEGAACAPWSRRIITYSFLVVDDSSIQVTLESIASPHVSALPAKSQLTTFHLRRHIATGDDAISNSFGTMVLLGIVALVKFGPRMYLKWKGINPALIMGGTKKTQNMTIEQRVELVKRQRALMDEMKAKKLI